MADPISVIDAAILVAGGDPSETYYHCDEHVQKTHQHDGYNAVFPALRLAILSNKLKAEVRLEIRSGTTRFNPDEVPYEAYRSADYEKVTYDMLVTRLDAHGHENGKTKGQTKRNFSIDSLQHEKLLYIAKEPNWTQTTLDVEDLRKWLEKKGVFPEFFFPMGNKDSVSNKNNPRYSAKLSCALAAWRAVKRPGPNKSVKQTLQDWVQSNGVKYGVGENDVVSTTAAEEIAKIANWNTKGGANPTPSDTALIDAEQTVEVENYPFDYNSDGEDDDNPEVPF